MEGRGVGSPADSVVSPVRESGSRGGDRASSSWLVVEVSWLMWWERVVGACDGTGAGFDIGPDCEDFVFLDFEGIVSACGGESGRASSTMLGSLAAGFCKSWTWIRIENARASSGGEQREWFLSEETKARQSSRHMCMQISESVG